MSDVNNAVFTGRIGRDPEMKYAASGTEIVNFSLVVERRRKGSDGKPEVDWFDVVAFGKTATFVAQYLDKGARVAIEGLMQQDRWEKDGEKHSRVKIIANSVQAMESKFEAERRRGGNTQQAPAQQQAPPAQQAHAPAPVQQAPPVQQAMQAPQQYQHQQAAPDPFGDIDGDSDPFSDQ